MLEKKYLKLFGVGPDEILWDDMVKSVKRLDDGPYPAGLFHGPGLPKPHLPISGLQVGYKEYIRAIVEASTVHERKFDHCRLMEAIAEFRSTPAPKPDSMILPWCVLLFAIGAVVYFLTELPEMVRVLAGG